MRNGDEKRLCENAGYLQRKSFWLALRKKAIEQGFNENDEVRNDTSHSVGNVQVNTCNIMYMYTCIQLLALYHNYNININSHGTLPKDPILYVDTTF